MAGWLEVCERHARNWWGHFCPVLFSQLWAWITAVWAPACLDCSHGTTTRTCRTHGPGWCDWSPGTTLPSVTQLPRLPSCWCQCLGLWDLVCRTMRECGVAALSGHLSGLGCKA